MNMLNIICRCRSCNTDYDKRKTKVTVRGYCSEECVARKAKLMRGLHTPTGVIVMAGAGDAEVLKAAGEAADYHIPRNELPISWLHYIRNEILRTARTANPVGEEYHRAMAALVVIAADIAQCIREAVESNARANSTTPPPALTVRLLVRQIHSEREMEEIKLHLLAAELATEFEEGQEDEDRYTLEGDEVRWPENPSGMRMLDHIRQLYPNTSFTIQLPYKHPRFPNA